MKLNELKAEIVRNGLTIEQLADEMGIGRTTLWRKFSNPNNFTLKEITDIGEILNVNGERILEIFFTKKVS